MLERNPPPHDLEPELERWHPASYAWALACCSGRAEVAEDVLQTVYLKILQGKARFDGRSHFKTWLFSVIRNTAADERRRRALELLKWGRYRETLPGPATADPVEQTLRDQMLALFRQALGKLPRRQREVLHLVFYQEVTVEQAGEVLGISVGSARTHYHRGKKRLRKLWNERSCRHGLQTSVASVES